MRCSVHPDQEAVAICKACGGGVCPQCRSVIGGISYCYACTVAGRYRRSPMREPMKASLPPLDPADSLTRRFYGIGIAGLILFGVSFHLVWAFGLFWLATPSLWGLNYAATNLLLTVGFSFLAIGMALSGFAFLGLQRHFGVGQGFAAAASSFLFAWWPVTADLLKYTGLVLSTPFPVLLMFPGPLYSAYVTLQAFGLTMIVVTMILWARALFAVRHPSQQDSVATNASVLIIVAVLFTIILIPIDLASRSIYTVVFAPVELPIFLVSALMLEPAALLIALLLYRARRGIGEKPTKRQQRIRPATKSLGNPLQWIRR